MDINTYHTKGSVEAEELLNLKTVSKEDIFEIIKTARDLKLKSRQGERLKKLAGKNIFLMAKNHFGKARLAFEIAVRSLDANPISVPMGGSDIEELISSPDTMKVLERFNMSLAVVDTSDRTDALTLSKTLALPVINANERAGACHSIAVLLTVWERKNRLEGLKAVIVGDFEQDQTSLLYGMVKCGMDVTVLAPDRYANIQRALERAREYGDCKWSGDVEQTLRDADVIYCYGNEFGYDFQMRYDDLRELCPTAVYLQNIPLVHGKEADEALLTSDMSAIYDQGENLLHAERAAIYLLGK